MPKQKNKEMPIANEPTIEKPSKKRVKKAPKTVKKKVQVIGRVDEKYYRTRSGQVMAVLKVAGTPGVKRFAIDKMQELIKSFTSGLRTMDSPFNFIILDFLVEHQQIDYLKQKMNELDLSNPIGEAKHYWLTKELDLLIWRQTHATEEQYFMLLFADHLHDLKQQVNAALEIGYLNAKEAPIRQADQLIYKINNLNSSANGFLGGYEDAT